MHPTPVIFVLEGTLLDSLAATKQAAGAAFLHTFAQPAPVQVVPIAGRLEPAFLGELLAHAGPAPDRAAFHQAYVGTIPGALARRGALVLPGVGDLLRALDADPRCRLALAAECGEAVARAKLRHARLEGFFPGGGYAEPGDTDAAAVVRRAVPAGVDPARCVVVTAYPLGLEAARALGMRCVGVGTGQGGPAPLAEAGADAVFPDLTDRERVVEWLLG